MPKKSTRKRQPGGGRKAILENPARVVTYLEEHEAKEIDLLGKRTEVARTALREYLKREDVRAAIEEKRELMALADDAYMRYDGS